MEDNVLLSGSFDKTIRLFDVRTDSSSAVINLSSEIESLDWSCVNKYLFVSSYENGFVDVFDIRKMNSMMNFQAHKKETSCVNFSNKKEGLFASVGSDSHVKIWDINSVTTHNNSTMPSLICEKFVKKTTGELFCVRFSDDVEHTIAVGGSTGEIFIWQLEENPSFCNHFGIPFVEEKIDDKFNNISKKRMMSNRIGFKGEKSKWKNNKKSKR